MRKSIVRVVLGAGALAAVVLLVWLSRSGRPPGPRDETLTPRRQSPEYEPLTVLYPLDGAVFPPQIAPPTFRWEDSRADADGWLLQFEFQDGNEGITLRSPATEWTPSEQQWEIIQGTAREQPARVTIQGYRRADPKRILSRASLSISTSQDEVGAPLFFREVNLPFLTAVKDPAACIRWRFGEVSSREPPPIVLEKVPVCGNCHSFSADGSTLAMEIDSGNDKASYAIAPVEEEIVLDPTRIITWSDYRREEKEHTFGLLCQASPDGRYVVGTVKDRALAVYRPDLEFSQLFFLVKGILAIYDRQTKTFSSLPGADDPEHVQTNATWSPDGKAIVFARSHSKAYNPPGLQAVNTVLVPPKAANEFLEGGRKFMYDLYRIPFNGGKGGKAEPIEGASDNGMSNYFAKFSPDGKWIVFCRARSFMLLQPDSELYIIPAEGGEARRLRCNTRRMNSWHSWSPNGRWLVFSSKAYSPYTQLFLTHIDQQGRSTPPVVLANFTEKNRAANIPEFANVKPAAIKRIRVECLDDVHYLRAGDAFLNQGDYENAIPLYRKALEMNPDNARVHTNWGTCLLNLGKLDEAKARFVRAIALEPDLATAHCNLGIVLRGENKSPEAVESYREAVRLDPDFVLARLHLGTLLLESGVLDEAKVHLAEAVRLDPRNPFAHFNLAMALRREGKPAPAADHLRQALQQDSDFVPALVSLALIRAASEDDGLRNGRQAIELATRACELTRFGHPEALHALGAAYAEAGRFAEAVSAAKQAIRAAGAAGNQGLSAAIQQALEGYQQQRPFRSSFY